MRLQNLVRDIYKFIYDNLYYNIDDIVIKEENFNSSLLMSVFTAIVSGKQLIVGEPGLGKTTTSEYVASLFYSLPLEIVWNSEIHGNPEQTEEKMVGRPDLGKLNLGEEEVIWSLFPQLPVKIVDEINRLPQSKQDLLLDSIDRGIWKYLDEIIINDENCLFATANYVEGSGFGLTQTFLDRFDIVVESKHPGAVLSFELIESKKVEKLLRNSRISREMIDILKSKIDYDEKIIKLNELNQLYSEYIEDIFGIRTLTRDDRDIIRQEVENITFDKDAEAFVIMLISESSFCSRYGQKRIIDECIEGCHYSEYLCSKIKSCLSNRFPQSLIKYSKALAWFLGDKKVDLEHITAITPYILAHRVVWREKHVLVHSKDERRDFVELHLAKIATEEVLRRYREQSDKLKEAFKVAYDVINSGTGEFILGDHPVYEEIKKAAELAKPKVFEEFSDYVSRGIKVKIEESKGVDEILDLYEEWLDAVKDEDDVDCAYALALDMISDLSFRSKDISEFSRRIGKYSKEKSFSKSGLFLSALINCCVDEKIVLELGEIGRSIDYIGYLNEKEIIIEGDTGNLLGLNMKGVIRVSGRIMGIGKNDGKIYRGTRLLQSKNKLTDWIEWIKKSLKERLEEMNRIRF